jgi:alkylation response protein AidB-like acyl-CoA dehydrogenase
MTGDSHFSEVFFTDVRIPVANVLGGPERVNDGWRAAIHTLANERNMIGSASVEEDFDVLVELVRSNDLNDQPVVRQQLARVKTNIELLRFLGYRMQTAISRGEAPGPETSVLKLLYGQHLRLATGLGKEFLGANGMLDGEPGAASGFVGYRFLWAPHSGIAGGTNEVQRNIIGERVLGLPGEPRPSPAVPGHAATDK